MCEKEIATKNEFSSWKKRLKRHVPILAWLPLYKKMDLIADMIAGLTVGLTLIPQSVAYAGLAGLSPEYGLYSSFMGSFMYVVFGTIKEVSVGPTSLLCLLTFEFTRDLPIEFVFLLTFMCGSVEFLLGLLQFGFLVNFISIPVTVSFQSAVSLIIISSQLKDLFGVPKFKSGRFLDNISAVVRRITEARAGDLTLSIFCCTFLLLLRVVAKLKDVNISKNKEPTRNEKILKKTLWFISISRNAICVFICCVLAYVFSLYGRTPFRLSDNIPAGLPSFKLPPFSIKNGNETLTYIESVYEISYGILVIPLISILANVTIAKAFCEWTLVPGCQRRWTVNLKLYFVFVQAVGVPVNATQEMLTLGLCNVFGSFVSSLPTCGAFTRSAVSNSSGVRTPLAGLFTGALIILVIKFLTPYFYYIPRATLASVLVCAVIFLIDWKTILLLWKVSKTDFLCSIITFTACLMLGIQTGLFFGIVVNTGHLLYLWARPSVLVQIKTTPEGSYYDVRPDIGLYFPATDFIRNTISRRCIQNIPVVVDCVHFKGIDYTTARAINELGQHCRKRGQKLVFLNMSSNIYKTLKNANVDISLKESAAHGEDLNNILFHSEENLFAAILLESESSRVKDEVSPEGKPLLKQ